MSDVIDPVGAAPETRSVKFAALLFGTCAAPIFWLGQLMLGYGVTAYVCYPGDHPVALTAPGPLVAALLVFDVVALAASAAGAAVSWTSWRRSRAGEGIGHAREGRDRFLAMWGLLSSLWFFFAILFNVIASVMVPPCSG